MSNATYDDDDDVGDDDDDEEEEEEEEEEGGLFSLPRVTSKKLLNCKL